MHSNILDANVRRIVASSVRTICEFSLQIHAIMLRKEFADLWLRYGKFFRASGTPCNAFL
ncbi:MAG: hypothetical protein A4S14_05920 [Proteobacteria bacterium SG_bin9]|nr:MAG: hypothetical protein A4S14_05920 [Proteobacteria bacterium SG_bin9]